MSNQGLNGAGPLSHEQVTQWIGEIQTLKQQVTDLKRDRDAAYQAADAWQARYTTEAQQRRADREQFQQQQTRLQGEVDRLRGNPDAVLDGWEPLGEAASVGARQHSGHPGRGSN